MAKLLFILTAIWATVTFAKVAHLNCPKNETYSQCDNNGCQNTCASPNIAKVCRATCIPGCVCQTGHLRNTKGTCVKSEECDTCGPNEIFDLCDNTLCVDTCAAPDLHARCDPTGCNAGCICKEGHLRDDEGKCVEPKECKCRDPNEEHAPCGDVCALTCADVGKGPRACPEFCLVNGGCVCKSGYVRSYNGKCIASEDCKKDCKGPNEFFSCGSACDTTCATLGERCPIVNIKCNEMCYCKDGFARNKENVCVPVEECPPKH